MWENTITKKGKFGWRRVLYAESRRSRKRGMRPARDIIKHGGVGSERTVWGAELGRIRDLSVEGDGAER